MRLSCDNADSKTGNRPAVRSQRVRLRALLRWRRKTAFAPVFEALETVRYERPVMDGSRVGPRSTLRATRAPERHLVRDIGGARRRTPRSTWSSTSERRCRPTAESVILALHWFPAVVISQSRFDELTAAWREIIGPMPVIEEAKS